MIVPQLELQPAFSRTDAVTHSIYANFAQGVALGSIEQAYGSGVRSLTKRLLPETSVNLVQEDALSLLDGLSVWWEFQSTQAYLKDPPSSYPVDGVDLMGGLQQIRQNVTNGQITKEWDFQVEIQTLIWKASDGHFAFFMDLLNVLDFGFQDASPLVSISEDGVSLPKIFQYFDLVNWTSSATWQPSDVATVNGQNVTDYIDSFGMYAGYADPDARWNAQFYEVARNNSMGSLGVYIDGSGGLYRGESLMVTFTNGSNITYEGIAASAKDFTGVDSGDAFYSAFCSPVAAATTTGSAQSTAASSSATATATSEATPREHFPEADFLTEDGSVAGYFLNGSYSDTAVLSILGFSENAPQDAQSVVQDFLEACRKQNKTKLIIDLQSNPGGNVYLGYDIFKQLFPTLSPYALDNMRANSMLDILGTSISKVTNNLRKTENPLNYTTLEENGGFSIFDAASYTDPYTMAPFADWATLYGPYHFYNDNFTNLILFNVTDPGADIASDGLVVSGYGNRSDLAPQAFESENMVLLYDSMCDSTCTTFSNLMKWQGKVRSVVAGGRPQTGQMQGVAGVRGAQVYPLASVMQYVDQVWSDASKSQRKKWEKTNFGTLYELGQYVIDRTVDPSTSGYASVNLRNTIIEEEGTFTPWQFQYHAADCRFWWTYDMIFNMTAIWKKAAELTWGYTHENGTVVTGNFSQGCIAGSTGQSSSLTGNATLYDNGTERNITSTPGTEPGSLSSDKQSSSSGGGSDSESAASGIQMKMGWVVICVGLSALLMS
ncbi:putative peptidase s41 family protein [Phaeomoniella chlamydospora]|uniref:Putative peptidase s41 family protein n=1 Tax=Phaeomoniella chlamydospora TaxID=158046 RepID=A0A0G2HKM1_PHACM|nr:putative peptidase s41 family protein [Phaeomoniella chlamydospora]